MSASKDYLMVFQLNVPPRPRPPFAIRPERIEPSRLTDIIHRADVGMNPEGAALLYPQDVGALLGEIMYLREQVAQALVFLRQMPIAHDADLNETADLAATLWANQEKRVWEKTTMLRMREQVASMESTLRMEREDMRLRSEAMAEQTAAFVRDQERRTLEAQELSRMRRRLAELEEERSQERENVRLRLSAVKDLLDGGV